jgi:hypothetical protein
MKKQSTFPVSRPSRIAVGLACILTFLTLSQLPAAVIYRETYGRPDGATGNIGTSVFDWARFNMVGTVANIATSGVSSDGTGKPTDLANTPSAGPEADDTFNPYAEGWTYQDGTIWLSMTPEFSFNPSDYVEGSIAFSWYQGNAQIGGVTDQPFYLAIQIDGAWYASATGFTNEPVTSGANFGLEVGGAEFRSLTYDPAAANWLTLNFDGTYDVETSTATASTLGDMTTGAAPVSDLTGTITAFGLYRSTNGANARFDTFQIDATLIPEPGTVALLSLAGVSLLLFRRRR